ncbi:MULTISPECIES: hypothetical protein [Alistipes]|uniref:hypothetical protein n=1 Tax=Alistipes TaxID=239759 RepID=UPI001B3A6AB4|nr:MULTISPECIES: hypothetical protein [Alistipes]MBQ4904156.1 hypothetical protein [Alistipes sp. Marseille-P2263]MCI2258241.1 hypothetical protein [Alistipes dispar]
MKKIMFNDHYGLTQAVIEGRKTMTRRMISGYPLLPEDRIEDASICPDGFVSIIANGGESLMEVKYHYKVGEIVAVAQSYNYLSNIYHDKGLYLLQLSKVHGYKLAYITKLPGWRNKMFVIADLMPHRIRITGIKGERLQDISGDDCLKEGLQYFPKIDKFYFEDIRREKVFYFDNPREAFAALIDKVSGRGTWASNPWVVAYEFELVK